MPTTFVRHYYGLAVAISVGSDLKNRSYRRCNTMNLIEPTHSAADYRRALARVETIFEATSGTPGFDELDILDTLIYAYKTSITPF